MSSEFDPVAGHWYKDLDKDEEIFIIEVYEDDGIVEIQHFDGEVDEVELDSWTDLNVEPIEPPEDWVGPYEDVESDDLGYEE